jgi:plastocyanin
VIPRSFQPKTLLNRTVTDSVLLPMQTSLPRRLSVLVVVAGLAVAASACSSSGSSKASPKNDANSSSTIVIANFAFSEISVKAGSTVTVSNNDTTTHTVSSDDSKSFDVKVDQGKSATFTAPSAPGTYKFHCKIHSTMHGTLTVT